MEYSYEELRYLSEEKIREAAKSQSSAIELFNALNDWKKYYLDESDKELRKGFIEMGEEYTARCKALNPKVDMLKAYINEYKDNW
jgi:uncharacterized protein YbgA (DUF1722 family)